MIPKNVAIRLDALAAMRTTKADLAHEKAEFAETCERAERKGDRAQELLTSPECDVKRLDIKASDFEVRK